MPSGSPLGDEGQGRLNVVSVDPPVARLDTELYGRSDVLQGIQRGERTLADGSRAKIHILHGLGGSGKTHLALAIADAAQKAGRDVWWVSTSQLSSSMREVATRVGAADKDIDRAWAGVTSPSDLVWRCLNNYKKPWLLIFDNADDPNALSPAGGDVADGNGWLRRPTGDGIVVVTTREGAESLWGPWCYTHAISPLDDETGARLLLDRATDRAGDLDEARKLSAALGGLPLALRAAGDYLKSVHETKVFQGEDAIRTFAHYREALSRLRPPSAVGQFNVLTLTEILGQKVVEEVFNISLMLLSLRGLTQAKALVGTLAFFDTVSLPYAVVLNADVLARSPLFPDDSARQVLSVLEGMANLALISTEVDSSLSGPYAYLLSLHPLVRAIARADPDTQANFIDYQQLAFDLLMHATEGLSPDQPENWAAWHLLEPHITESAVGYLTADNTIINVPTARAALELSRRSARYLIATRLLPPSVANNLKNKIAAARRFGFKHDSVEVMALRHERARVFLEGSDFQTAIDQLTTVIADRTRVLGPIHPDTLASRHKRGRAVMGLQDWSRAEAEFVEILEGEAQLTEARPYDTNVVRHSLARAILFQGRRAQEAEAHVRQALTELSGLRPAKDPEVIFASDTLAQCLDEQGHYQEAIEVINTALEAVGPREEEWEQVAWLRKTKTDIEVRHSSDPTVAVAVIRQTVDELRKRLGDDNPETRRATAVLSRLESSI